MSHLEVLRAAGEGEYVGTEQEILTAVEVNGKQEYTDASLNIEGSQDPNWQLIMDETRRAMNYVMSLHDLYKPVYEQIGGGQQEFTSMLNGAYAVANSVLQHRARLERLKDEGGPESGPLGDDHEPDFEMGH